MQEKGGGLGFSLIWIQDAWIRIQMPEFAHHLLEPIMLEPLTIYWSLIKGK